MQNHLFVAWRINLPILLRLFDLFLSGRNNLHHPSIFPFIPRRDGLDTLPNKKSILDKQKDILGHIKEPGAFGFARHKQHGPHQCFRKTTQQFTGIFLALQSLRVRQIRFTCERTRPYRRLTQDDSLAKLTANKRASQISSKVSKRRRGSFVFCLLVVTVVVGCENVLHGNRYSHGWTGNSRLLTRNRGRSRLSVGSRKPPRRPAEIPAWSPARNVSSSARAWFGGKKHFYKTTHNLTLRDYHKQPLVICKIIHGHLVPF